METIEIGAVKVREGSVVDRFETFIRPEYINKLTPFCTELTGITIDDLANSPMFNEAILEFYKFIYDCDIYSCGDFDRKFLIRELEEKGTTYEHELARNAIHSSHTDLKKHYSQVTSKKKKGMIGMANELGIELSGINHRALSDSLNLTNIYLELERIRSSYIKDSLDEMTMTNLVSNLNNEHDYEITKDKDLYIIEGEKYKLIEFVDLMKDIILTDNQVRGLNYLSVSKIKSIIKYGK